MRLPIKIKLFVLVFLSSLGLGGSYIQLARALDTASVVATVTVQNISVAVSDGSVTYGIMSVGTSKSTADIPDVQTATNDGNVVQDLNIRGSNSANWTLAATVGANQYVHKLSVGTTSTLTTSYTTLATNVGVGTTRLFNLILFTPSSSTNYTPQSVDVTVQAVAN